MIILNVKRLKEENKKLREVIERIRSKIEDLRFDKEYMRQLFVKDDIESQDRIKELEECLNEALDESILLEKDNKWMYDQNKILYEKMCMLEQKLKQQEIEEE